MAIKNTSLGGTDWTSEALVYTDLNDTIDAAFSQSKAYTDQEAGMKLLGSTTLGSAGASLAVSSLATSSYSEIVVVFLGEIDSANGAILRFNSDTGSNYYYRTTEVDGTTADVTASPGTSIGIGKYSSGVAFGGRLHIAQYQGTWTPIITGQTFDSQGLQRADIGGNWNSTAEITKIDLIPTGGNWQIGSRVHVYGIKSA